MTQTSQILDKPASVPFVEATLNYLVPMAERPFNYTYEPPSGVPQSNGKYKAHTLPIHNARAIASDLTLDHEGFALAVYSSAVHDFYDDEEVRQIYYPEAERFLTKITGASKVVVFDHNVRSGQQVQQRKSNAKEPVQRVHNDFTAKSGYSRAQAELTARGVEDSEALLQGRFAVVNVWRSIAPSVQKTPLAVCDAQSIAFTDLVASDLVYRDRVGETYAITHSPTHRWFYFPQMQRDEVLLIKCFDSAENGRARFAAHTAFDDPTSPPDAPPRESIELRTLLFYSS